MQRNGLMRIENYDRDTSIYLSTSSLRPETVLRLDVNDSSAVSTSNLAPDTRYLIPFTLAVESNISYHFLV